MELSPKQQILEIVKKSQNFLIISHQKPGGDSVGSMLSFVRILEKLGKNVQAVMTESVPNSLDFLPDIHKITREIDNGRDLVFEIDIENIELEKISTDTDRKKLSLVITTSKGFLSKDRVNIKDGKPKFDAIIVLDTSDVDKIDKLYDEYTELFFETPIVNIDHHAGNEYFGTINLVDMTATSTAEILVSIFESLGTNKLDEETATLLLVGITADTASFKSQNTTPKSLTVAAQLLASGARQQEIIGNLYKKKSLKTLKLWGKILSNVNSNPELRIVWSYVRYQDFESSGASLEETHEVLNELLSNTPNADVVCLMVETEKEEFTVKLKGIKGSDVLEIAEAFGGTGHSLSAGFELRNVGFEAAQFEVLKRMQEIRAKKIGREGRGISNSKLLISNENKNSKISTQKNKNVEDVEKIKTKDRKEETKEPDVATRVESKQEVPIAGEKDPEEKKYTSEAQPPKPEVNPMLKREKRIPYNPDGGSVEDMEDKKEVTETQASKKELLYPSNKFEKSEKNDETVDPIAKAIESLEAAKKEKDEPTGIDNEEDKHQIVPAASLTPLSEILKKFKPGPRSDDKPDDDIKIWREK